MDAKHGLVKVTIVGYYTISSDELDVYEVPEFDPEAMAEVDASQYREGKVSISDVVEWFRDGRATSVEFEAVDMSDVDMSC